MIEELIKYETDRGLIRIQRVNINLTTRGLYEGINQENILWNLEMQGQPFSRAPIPMVYLGIDDFPDLSKTYSIWALLESEAVDPEKVISSLAVCSITDTWEDVTSQVKAMISKVDYWGNCKDFDL